MSNNIYYFTASWCGPCKAISPDIQRLNEKYESVNFYKLDVDDENNNDLCEKYKITSIPCFLFFKDKKYIEKMTGSNLVNLEKKIIEIF